MNNTDEIRGVLRGIAMRPTDGDPMREMQSAQVIVGVGLHGENRPAGKREVTLLSAESWAEACHELGVELPWPTRRANLLISRVDLVACVDKTLAIGDVQLRIHGESKPCAIMDRQHAGLRQALKPNYRGGVVAEVLTAGALRVGDSVTVHEPQP